MQQPDEHRKVEAANEQLRVDYAQWFAIAPASVLHDLQGFCRAHESTFHPNTHVAARLDGRREVWLRMQTMAKLDPDVLFKLYMTRKVRDA